MALKSNNVAIAIAIQPTDDTFQAPTLPNDQLVVSQLRPSSQAVTIANDEATGTPIRNADEVAGSTRSISFNVKARPPVGGSVPAANTFGLGKLLQAAKFTEIRQDAPIPASPEALGAGVSDIAVTLGTTAAGTADLYKGFPLLLSDQGATYKRQLTALRSYAANKDAELMSRQGSTPSANYQIPAFLGYARAVTSDDPIQLSGRFWLDGHRYDFKNARVSSLQLALPTSTRDQAQFPEFQVTLDFDLEARSEESTPAVPSLGAVPLYKDGVSQLDHTPYCTSNVTVDLGVQVEYPACPNSPSGSDAPELVGSTASVNLTAQHYLPSVIDTEALAEAQAYHPFIAQWGLGAGQMVQVVVPDARLSPPGPDTGGNIITENGVLLIDALDRGVMFNFPF